jgi:zinc transporter 2
LLLDAAYVHALGDLLQNLGVLLAAALIYFKPWDIGETDGVSNWMYADPFCTTLFSILVLWSTMSPLRRSVATIMQESPSHVDVEEYERKLLAVDHVVDVQDLHVWSVGSNKTLGTAHLLIDASDNSVGVLNECVRISRATEIYHTTFQLNVRGLFDHSIFSDWGGIHGHERCCGVPVPISPSKSSNHSNEKDHGHGHRDEKDPGHGHGDVEHGHGHGHGHGRAH